MQTTVHLPGCEWFGAFADASPTASFQWHYESLPCPKAPGADRRQRCLRHQAFAIDTCSRCKFHIEIDAEERAVAQRPQRELSRLTGEPYVQMASVMAAQMAKFVASQRLQPIRSTRASCRWRMVGNRANNPNSARVSRVCSKVDRRITLAQDSRHLRAIMYVQFWRIPV